MNRTEKIVESYPFAISVVFGFMFAVLLFSLFYHKDAIHKDIILTHKAVQKVSSSHITCFCKESKPSKKLMLVCKLKLSNN